MDDEVIPSVNPDFMMDYDSLPFIPGLELSARFFRQGVKPVLESHFPHVPFAAARLDFGSEVLGFDTPQSRDHGWGPKVTLFLSHPDHKRYQGKIQKILADELPLEICGYPTNYDVPFSGEAGLLPVEQGPVNHWVEVTTVQTFLHSYLGVDTTAGLTPIDWLVLLQQHLATIASGKIFHDDLGHLTNAYEYLGWYPLDIWLYLLANQWRRIDQEEPFMARCGDTGDDLGSRLLAARMVDETMHLCFLMERKYAPYYKWFVTAFRQLSCATELIPIFRRVFNSQSWLERESHLSDAYLVVMEMHNSLGLTPEIEPEIAPFHNRPYQVPHTARFSNALHEAIQSDEVRGLPRNIGALDQFVNSTDILSDPQMGTKFRGIYKQSPTESLGST